MRNSRLHHPWLLTLLCVMLLVVRVGGAHLHLCFDGGEPPVSFHLEDAGIHHQESGVSAPHQDQEVMLADEAIGKFSKLSLELPVLLVAALLAWAVPLAPRQPAPGYSPPFYALAARLLRPPLRGPPLTLSL